MTLQEGVTFVTLVIALYGAGLSTWNAFKASQRDQRLLSVRLNTVYEAFVGRGFGPPMLQIEVVNIGHRDLVADAPQLQVGADKRHVMVLVEASGLSDFPKRLQEGERASVRIGYRDFALSLQDARHRGKVKLYGLCKDSSGETHRSKPLDVDLQEWLRMGD
jgi:hypothetical protein